MHLRRDAAALTRQPARVARQPVGAEVRQMAGRHNSLLHWIDGVRGSTPVLVQWRAHGREREPYAVATHVGRHPLGRMRELAQAA